MKLIPPGNSPRTNEEDTIMEDDREQTQESGGREKRAPLVSLEALAEVGTVFSNVLEKAVEKLQEEATQRVSALASLLENTTQGIRQIMEGNYATTAGDGRARRSAAAGVGVGKRRRGRPRKADSGAGNSQVAVGADGAAPKRGRGRPKGSKNKPKSGRGPGRPRKTADEPAKPAQKRRRGRPRKSVVRKPQRAAKPQRELSTGRDRDKKGKPSGRKRTASARNSRKGGQKGGGAAPAAKVAEQPAAAKE